jgi:hypothetical protein
VLLAVAQEHLEAVGEPSELAAATAEAERGIGARRHGRLDAGWGS